ncbi:MAG: TIGR04086 family membrane protein [Clostridiales bacterium]|nr:TIGR04086 family membrane protein [Clostridiales bacterium]
MDRTFRNNTRIFYILEGLLLSYIVTAILLLLISFLLLKFDLPGAVISGLINVTYILSAFAGGFFIGKKTEQRKFIWGLILGVFYFVILMLVSIMMNSVGTIHLGSLFTVFIITSLSGMLGGMIS